MRNRVLVVGASGKTGCLVIEKLLQDGHIVRAVSRTAPSGLSRSDTEGYEFVRGNVCSDDPAPWMVNIDAVVFAAAGDSTTENAVDHLGAEQCAAAAKASGISRFVLVSAHGAHDPMSWGPEFRSYLEAKAGGERAVRMAFPETIVLRPGILTDEREKERAIIRTTTGPGEQPVSRADVASIVTFCATQGQKKAAILEIVGGDQPIQNLLEQILGSDR